MKLKQKIFTGVMSSFLLLGIFSPASKEVQMNKQRRTKVVNEVTQKRNATYSDEEFMVDGGDYVLYSENTYAYLIEWVDFSFDIVKTYNLTSRTVLENYIEEMNSYEDVIPDDWSSGNSSRYWLVVDDGPVTQATIDELCPPGTQGVGYEAEGYINLEVLGLLFYPYEEAFSLIENIDTIDPSLSINGQTNIYISNVDNPVTLEQVKGLLTAIDETDGDITDDIEVKSNAYEGNEKKLGTFPIVFQVSDSSGNIAETTINVVVRDITKPVISGKMEYTLKQTETLSLETIKSGLIITDNYDTLTKENLTLVQDNYTRNKTNVGTYNVIYKVRDNSTNSTQVTITVNVTDGIAPVINGSNVINTDLSLEKPLNELLSSYNAEDAEDGILSIEVEEDNYSKNKNKTGSYKVIVSATDESGNKSTKEITINVKDNIPPVFTAEDIINVDYYNTLTHEQIVALLTEREVVSYQVLTDEYSGNEGKAGKYRVEYRVKFDDGTTEDFIRYINVINNEPWYVSIWNSIVNFFENTFNTCSNWLYTAIIKPIINFFANIF